MATRKVYYSKNRNLKVEDEAWKDILLMDPEPVLSSIFSDRDKDVSYFKCPSFIDYYKNCYLIRSPIDLKLTLTKNADNTINISNDQYPINVLSDMVYCRFNENKTFAMMTLNINYIFFSEESLLIEQLPPIMHSSELQNNIRIICGTYDIGKWFRAIEMAFEIEDESKIIDIKRGDPLYYVRFNTLDKVVLVEKEYTEDIHHLKTMCISVKTFIKNNTLKENYSLFAKTLKKYRSKIFGKSKCPFNFKGETK